MYWSRSTQQRGAAAGSPDFPKKWEFTAGGPISAALALGENGSLYVASEDGFLYALDPAGTLQWKFEAGPLAEAPAIGTDGTIYVANRNQQIYSINPSGTQHWVWGGGPYADKNSLWRGGALDDNYYYTPWRGQLRAIRLSTGVAGWPTGMGFETEGSVSILPNGLIVFPGVGRLDAAEAGGRTSWQYPVMNPPLTTDMLMKNGGHPPAGNFWLESGIALGATGTLYAAAGGSHLVAISPAGTLQWEFKTPGNSTNRATPVIGGDGTIYFACGDGHLYAVNADGAQKWALQTGASIAATPLLAEDGTVYVLSSRELLAVSPEGKLVARVDFPGGDKSSPTLGPDGTLYVAAHTGRIVAFSTSHGPLMSSSPWPKFQRDLANSGRAAPI